MPSKMHEKLEDLSRRIGAVELMVAKYEARINGMPGHFQITEPIELQEARKRLASLYRSRGIVTRYLERGTNP
jgi:hypothetical protein